MPGAIIFGDVDSARQGRRHERQTGKPHHHSTLRAPRPPFL